MTVTDFIAVNFRDAERRLGRLTESVTDDQSVMWRIVDESAIGKFLVWIVQQCDRAQSTSLAMARWRRVASSWEASGPVGRMRMTGVVLLVAVGVHVMLAVVSKPVGGWWLILPGIVGLFGVTAITLSFLGPPTKVRD